MAQRTSDLGRTLASAGGAALAGTIRLIAAVRPAAKPLHPRGDVVRGRLTRTGSGAPTGSPWLDTAGSDEVLVRRSRAVGLPEPLPDIHGLAVRVPLENGRYGDLLLAMTGLGTVTRHLLTAGRSPGSRPLTTLLPYKTPTGALLVAATATGEDSYELLAARLGGEWRPFGRLELADGSGPDEPVSFDPVRNTLPGLDNYPWVRRLREPSYATARHSR